MDAENKLTLPIHQSERDGLIYVRSESDYIHASFASREGHILVFESIPGNSPSTSLGVFENKAEYLDSLKGISWVNEPEYIVQNNIPETGFPFTE